MAAILLDVDGVMHVSGDPIPGAAEALGRLRRDGHRLRFVTNTTIRSRTQLAEQLRSQGVEVEDDEVQTAAAAAVRALRGQARPRADDARAGRPTSRGSSSSARTRTPC